MIPFFFNYASPSVLQSTRDEATLGLTADERRPVRFHGRVKREAFLLRTALRAVGEVIWSNDLWLSDGDRFALLDPIVTVHPGRVFFEAFSQDQSAYVCLIVDRDLFETEGEVRTGTTNVDFTAWLWAALAEMRTSRDTWLRVDAGGLEVRTEGGGGRFEQKVEVPEAWVRGFLQLQAAMAMPGTRLTVRPVDLVAAIRFLQVTKAKLSPRAMRYEFPPGEDARLILEPWEQVIPLRGAEHSYTEPRSIRLWGRRRLRLLQPVLPFATQVDVYLKGRGLPSFYAVKLPGMTFLLGLTGWSGNRFTDSGGFDLVSGLGRADEALVERCLTELRTKFTAPVKDLAAALERPVDEVARACETLCRRGLAIFDVETRAFRHRELFEQPIDEARLYPPDARREEAAELLRSGAVTGIEAQPQETRKMRKLKTPDGPVEREIIYREWRVAGTVGEQARTEIVVNDLGRIIFGTCGCPFFQDNLFARGPCAHMIALLEASHDQRGDLPVSVPGPERPKEPELDEDGEEEE